MINRTAAFLLVMLSFIFSSLSSAQDIAVIFHETQLTDTLGAEIVFDFEVINISSVEQTVFEVRTLNDLPEGWISSLCFGEFCFAGSIDSIATTPEFLTDPLQPGDTLATSLHVFTMEVTGTANVQIQIGTFNNPANRITQDFVATAILTSVNEPGNKEISYALGQNYPNPFNPTTNISFDLKTQSFVTLKIFNLLGEEVASLLNSTFNAGGHTIKFNAGKLNSGVYLYRLEAKGINGEVFNSVKKMILTK